MNELNDNPQPEEITRKLLGIEPSEFGAGLVVCLAKFAQHMDRYDYKRVYQLKSWFEMTNEERKKIEKQAEEYPHGDSANFMNNIRVKFGDMEEEIIADAISRCMNSASDHFYDLSENAPPSLKKLADLTLGMGHGYNKKYTYEEFTQVDVLFKQSCIELDRMLGVVPDWGRW